MSKYKIVSMSAAAVIIIVGLIYLNFGESTLPAVLGASAVCLCVMGGANAAELKKSGSGGFVAYIPAVCFAVLAAFVVAAMVFFLIQNKSKGL